MYLLALEEKLFDLPKKDIDNIIREFEPLIFKFFPNWSKINFDTFYSAKPIYKGLESKDLQKIFSSKDLLDTLEKDDSLLIVIDFQIKNSYRKKPIVNSIYSYINLSFNLSLFRILKSAIIENKLTGVGSFRDIKPFVEEGIYKRILEEFTKLTLQTSLAHELSHWLDDINHQNHIEIAIKKYNRGDTDTLYNAKFIDAHYMEINAQVHALQDLKQRIGTSKWNKINIYQAIYRIPTLNALYRYLKSLEDNSEKKWLHSILKRLAREKILGKNMNTVPADDSLRTENYFSIGTEYNYIENKFN